MLLDLASFTSTSNLFPRYDDMLMNYCAVSMCNGKKALQKEDDKLWSEKSLTSVGGGGLFKKPAGQSITPIHTGEGWFHPPKQSDGLLGMKERSEEAVTIL